MSDEQPIVKFASVHCASKTPGHPVRGFNLSANVPLGDEEPWPESLDDDAEVLFQTLIHGLPQGTLDRLTAKLMQRISSDMLLSFELQSQGRKEALKAKD